MLIHLYIHTRDGIFPSHSLPLSSRDGSQSLWVWGKCVRSTPETSAPLWKTVETYFMPCVRTLLVKPERSHLKFSFLILFLVCFKGTETEQDCSCWTFRIAPGSHHPWEQGWQGEKGSLGKCVLAQGLPMRPAISHSDCVWVSKCHPVWIRSWEMLSNCNIKTMPSVNVMKYFAR